MITLEQIESVMKDGEIYDPSYITLRDQGKTIKVVWGFYSIAISMPFDGVISKEMYTGKPIDIITSSNNTTVLHTEIEGYPYFYRLPIFDCIKTFLGALHTKLKKEDAIRRK
jgi:hypothetical protein